MPAQPVPEQQVEVRMRLSEAAGIVEFFATAQAEGVQLEPWQRELMERLFEVLPDGSLAAPIMVLATPRKPR